MSDARVTVRLVGPFGVLVGGPAGTSVVVGSRKARRLLARLAAARGGTVPVDALVDVLWPDGRPRRPEDNVATLVSRLRATLGADVVLGSRSGYRLGAVTLDLDQAAALADEARRRLGAGDATLAAVAAARGLELLGDGRILLGEPEAEWIDALGAEAAELLRTLRHLVAEAATSAGNPAAGLTAAQAAADADPLDERAHYLVMQAHLAGGEPQRALAAFERLRRALAEELGADPSGEIRALHVAILRGEVGPAPARRSDNAGGVPSVPAGRDDEIAVLTAAWSDTAAGRTALLNVTGEAGIGKTTLAQAVARMAADTGGLVLQARCYAAERSLFLQPLLDAVGPAVRAMPAAELRRLAGAGAGALAGLVPEAAELLGAPTVEQASAEMQRRRVYDALCGFVLALAAERPVLLLLDDLQNAGTATVELLHYLARRAAGARLLLLTTVRSEEGAQALDALADVASQVPLGPLSPDAVTLLATRAGEGRHAETILRRTRGHTLSVVESLRALRAGETGVPESLRAAVAARLRHVGPDIERVLRAGAVLGAAVAPDLVAAMLGAPEPDVVQHCEDAAVARLLVPAGERYEFANDLVQEVLYITTPAPMRFAHHRRAADLLSDRPETQAGHAEAVSDWRRAARAWLAAGRRAIARFASDDARVLLDRALAAAERIDEPGLTGRIHLARADVLAAPADYDAALADLGAALTAFRTSGDRHHEVTALRLYMTDLGGALRLSEVEDHLATGARLAEELNDPGAQADLYAGQAIIAANRLQFCEAIELGRRAVSAGRRSGYDEALAAGLDGLKTAYAYLGDIAALRPVLAELEPLVRRLGKSYVLSWLLFESALPAVAAGDWDAALTRIDESIAINRRNGMRAQEAWLMAHRGWVERLRGQLDSAAELGHRAVWLSRAAPHGWWKPAAHALLATTLLALDEVSEATRLLVEGRAIAERSGAEAYVLRCAAPLAEATGSPVDLAAADALLRSVQTPPGSAWLAGGDAYLSIARAWRRRGDPERARLVLAPLRVAADRHGWLPWQLACAAEDATVGLDDSRLEPCGELLAGGADPLQPALQWRRNVRREPRPGSAAGQAADTGPTRSPP